VSGVLARYRAIVRIEAPMHWTAVTCCAWRRIYVGGRAGPTMLRSINCAHWFEARLRGDRGGRAGCLHLKSAVTALSGTTLLGTVRIDGRRLRPEWIDVDPRNRTRRMRCGWAM
jgi:hypothetical protein